MVDFDVYKCENWALSMGLNFSVEPTSPSYLTTLVAELGVNLEVNLNTSFRVQNCLKRSWKRGISDCIHRLPIVLRILAVFQFYTYPLRFCWVIFGIKGQIDLSVLLFSPCFRPHLWPLLSIIWTKSVTSSQFLIILALLDTGKPFSSNQYGNCEKYCENKSWGFRGNRKSAFNCVVPPYRSSDMKLVSTVIHEMPFLEHFHQFLWRKWT